MKAHVRIIRENHHGAYFEKAVADKADEIKDAGTLVTGSFKATWLLDHKDQAVCILEWCTD